MASRRVAGDVARPARRPARSQRIDSSALRAGPGGAPGKLHRQARSPGAASFELCSTPHLSRAILLCDANGPPCLP